MAEGGTPCDAQHGEYSFEPFLSILVRSSSRYSVAHLSFFRNCQKSGRLDLLRKSEGALKQEVFDGMGDQVYGGVQSRGGERDDFPRLPDSDGGIRRTSPLRRRPADVGENPPLTILGSAPRVRHCVFGAEAVGE